MCAELNSVLVKSFICAEITSLLVKSLSCAELNSFFNCDILLNCSKLPNSKSLFILLEIEDLDFIYIL